MLTSGQHNIWDSFVNHLEMLLLLILRRNASLNFPLIRTMIIYITLSSEIVFPSIIIYDVYGNLQREIEQILSSTITDERTGTRNLDRSLSFMSSGSTKDQMNQIMRSLALPLSRTHIGGAEAHNEWGSLSLVSCELPILAPDPVGRRGAKAGEGTHTGASLLPILGHTGRSVARAAACLSN